MSFDVFLLKFAKDDPVCELPLGEFQAAIQKYDVRQTSESFFTIQLGNGSVVEVQKCSPPNSNRFTSAWFMIRGLNDAVAGLLFECARSTGGVLIPAADPSPCILVDVSQRDELPADFRQPLVECRSPAELSALLRTGYQAWSQYRDQVVQGGERETGRAECS